MKSKKGFTLVELLVVIALMLTILGIAIVSFINVSNNKKEEAWEEVKNQTEVAAEEYFGVYEYYLGNLEENDGYARVSIGKLVEEDYLNTVTNPVTGNSINECDYVEVTLSSSGSYSYKYHENEDDTSCDVNNYIVVGEVGAPRIEGIDITNLTGKGKSGNWYQDGAKFTLNYNTAGNGAITKIERCNTTDSSKYCNPDSNVNVETNPSYSYDLSTAGGNPFATVCYSVTNTSNKTATQCATANIDNTDPTCEVSAGNTKWTNRSVTVTGTCSDSGSGCKSNEITKTESEESKNANGTKVSPGTVTDKVGNSTQCGSATVYIDKTAPVIRYLEGPKKQACGGAAGVYIKYQVSDALSGVKEVYHYYGSDTGKKSYEKISGYDIRVLNFTIAGNNGPYTIERNWAVGNPSGCGSENDAGPNTSWCYYNNTAVKDYAGNTATGISSSCSKVGK